MNPSRASVKLGSVQATDRKLSLRVTAACSISLSSRFVTLHEIDSYDALTACWTTTTSDMGLDLSLSDSDRLIGCGYLARRFLSRLEKAFLASNMWPNLGLEALGMNAKEEDPSEESTFLSFAIRPQSAAGPHPPPRHHRFPVAHEAADIEPPSPIKCLRLEHIVIDLSVTSTSRCSGPDTRFDKIDTTPLLKICDTALRMLFFSKATGCSEISGNATGRHLALDQVAPAVFSCNFVKNLAERWCFSATIANALDSLPFCRQTQRTYEMLWQTLVNHIPRPPPSKDIRVLNVYASRPTQVEGDIDDLICFGNHETEELSQGPQASQCLGWCNMIEEEAETPSELPAVSLFAGGDSAIAIGADDDDQAEEDEMDDIWIHEPCSGYAASRPFPSELDDQLDDTTGALEDLAFLRGHETV